MNLILLFQSFTSQCCAELLNSMLVARWISSRPSSCNGRASVQGLEHRFLACGLLLRFCQHVPGVAAHCLEANHVLATQPGNPTNHHGLAAGALADLACNLRR